MLHVVHYTETPRIGGAERYLQQLTTAALDRGHRVTTLSPGQEVLEWISEQAPSGVTLRLGSSSYHKARTRSGRAKALASEFETLRRAFRELSPDVIHSNNGGYPGSDLCRVAPLAARLARVKNRFMTVHSTALPRDHSQPHVQGAVDAVLWRSLSAVICPSPAVQDQLSQRRGLPSALGRHVPSGVEEPQGADAAATLRRRLTPGGELLVGMVSGSGDPEKGHDVLIEALSRVPRVRAVIVGPHPGDFFARRIADLGLAERVVLEGPVPAVGAHYYAIDVLVMPSTAYESIGLVNLEAMAAGTPVFGSRLSGIPEAVDDGRTGRLFEPGSIAQLAQLLAWGDANRKSLAEMGRAARIRWESRFRAVDMVATVMDLFEHP